MIIIVLFQFIFCGHVVIQMQMHNQRFLVFYVQSRQCNNIEIQCHNLVACHWIYLYNCHVALNVAFSDTFWL